MANILVEIASRAGQAEVAEAIRNFGSLENALRAETAATNAQAAAVTSTTNKTDAAASAAAAQASADAAAQSAQGAASIAGVGVDTTLTVANSAADSKTVGDRLSAMNNEMGNFVVDNVNTSTNIWNGEYMDGKLFNYGMSRAPADYPRSLLIGYFPVEEGKTYTIANGGYNVGSLLFFNESKGIICGINRIGSAYGNETNSWPTIDGYAEVSGVGSCRTFKPLAGSGIRYACWYLTQNYPSTDYIGAHTAADLTTYLANVQVNEGNALLPYRPIKTGIVNTVKELYANAGGTKDYSNAKVVLIKRGNLAFIRSHFTNTTDMLIRTKLDGSQNKSFNYEYYMEVPVSQPYESTTGDIWKNAIDDITPINFNSSYRGANHGDDRGYTLTFSSNHGLTEANIGEVWVDANNKNFLIIEVPNATTIIGALLSDVMVSNAPCFLADVPLSPLVKASASLSFASATRGQLKPIVNHVSVELLVDDNEITFDGIYGGKNIRVVESYDLLYLPAMVNYLKANAGYNTNASHYFDVILEKYCTVTNTYQFTERGAVTLVQSIEWAKTVNLSFAGMVQSMSIGDYYCVPGTSLHRINQIGTTQINFDKAVWDDATNPPNRFYQYADSLTKKGMCLGYNAELGSGKPEVRKDSATAGFIYTSKKLYPKLVAPNVDTSTDIYAVSFRVPISNTSVEIPTVSWYYINDDVYLLIDAQRTADRYVALPPDFIARKIKVVESYGNINIVNEIVTAKGIRVAVNGYGSAVVRLKK